MSFRLMLASLCFSLPVAFFSGSANAGLLDNKFEKEVQAESIAVKLVRDTQKSGYQLITTAELKAKMDAGQKMLVIDAMPYKGSYVKGHVPGAVSFEFPIKDMLQWDSQKTANKTQSDYLQLLGNDKETMIVVYCGFVKCGRSHNGADWAVKLGYKNVYRYPGGIFAWKGADFNIEK